MNNYHNPVLLSNCIDGLDIKPNGIYVDATYGGGGHSKEILKKLNKKGKLLAFDQDEDVKPNLIQDERFTFINGNFCRLEAFLKLYNAYPVDGILADLGVSSHQFDVPERGFSIRFDAPLDLRMNNKKGITASEFIENATSEEIAKVLYNYGDFYNSKVLANAIERYKNDCKIITVEDLKKALIKYAPKGKENSFFARVFQALRIEINNELEVLKDFLAQTIDALKPGGRLVVISYHSLEDKLVKNIMKSGKINGILEKDFYGNIINPLIPLTKKPIVPDEEEISANNRARSAKLRIAVKY